MLFETLIFWFLLGAVAFTIVYSVENKITPWNLPMLIRDALGNSSEKRAKELLAQALQASVDCTEDNTVDLTLFFSDKESAKIKLTGTGIDEQVKVGMKISV